MADTEVPKAVPAASGITGSTSLNASVPANAKKSSVNSKTSASSKTTPSVPQSKTSLVKTALVKPGSPKTSTKPTSTNPSNTNQKPTSTTKTTLDSKQTSIVIDSKKPESRPSSSVGSTNKVTNSSESKVTSAPSSKVATVGSKTVVNVESPKSDSSEGKKVSKTNEVNKVTSSSSVDSKTIISVDSKLNLKSETVTSTDKDLKTMSKSADCKKSSSTSKSKIESNVQDSKKISRSEDNISSTVCDETGDNRLEQSDLGGVVSKTLKPVSAGKPKSEIEAGNTVSDIDVLSKQIVCDNKNVTKSPSSLNTLVKQTSPKSNIVSSDGGSSVIQKVQENIPSSKPLSKLVNKDTKDCSAKGKDSLGDKVVENISLETSSNQPENMNKVSDVNTASKCDASLNIDLAHTNASTACDAPSPCAFKKKSLDSSIQKAFQNAVVCGDGKPVSAVEQKPTSVLDKLSSVESNSSLVESKTNIATNLDHSKTFSETKGSAPVCQKNTGVSDVSALISDTATSNTVSKNDSNQAPTNTSLVPPEGPQTPAAEVPVPLPQQPPAPPPEESKQSIRLKVWDLLEKNNFVLFPRPCKGRIPHFVGSPEAAERLATLDVFKNARNVKVNPDKPQAHVRFLTLESGKDLLVPIPRLKSGLFKRVVPPPDATKEQLKSVVTQQGVLNSGKSINLEDKVSVDLVVMGAVAVSKDGYRIGKGEGYADLEFAIMMTMGAVTQDTIVVTTVHDDQVFDTLPNHLFKEHDVPVDWIVTPTQIIEVKPRLNKPSGIFWNILSNRRLNLIPILKTLREQQIADGKECHLKEVDSDPEDRPVRPHFRRFFNRFPRRPRRDNQLRNKGPRQPRESSAPPGAANSHPPQKNRQSRTFRRKPASARSSSAKEKISRNSESGNTVERGRAGGDGDRPQRRRYFRRPKAPIAFSVRVSGITQGTRVRDLKAALNERGVKPYDITWEANKGLALLHFAKDHGDKKPQLISEMVPISVVEGFPAKLEVKVPGHPKQYKFEWSVNGKSMDVNKGRLKVTSRPDGTVRLFIDKVQSEDSGEYTVTVKNTHGEISSKAPVVVAAKTKPGTPEEAPKFVNPLEDIFVEERTCLTVTAPITGNPVPEVEWCKDDVVLSPNDRMQFTCDGMKVGLELNSCRVIDGGIYKCKLSNHLGHVESSSKVTVNKTKQSNQRFTDFQQIEPTPESLSAINDIIASLRDLKVKGEGEEDPKESLSVEPANPISRIESTGISAV